MAHTSLRRGASPWRPTSACGRVVAIAMPPGRRFIIYRQNQDWNRASPFRQNRSFGPQNGRCRRDAHASFPRRAWERAKNRDGTLTNGRRYATCEIACLDARQPISSFPSGLPRHRPLPSPDLVITHRFLAVVQRDTPVSSVSVLASLARCSANPAAHRAFFRDTRPSALWRAWWTRWSNRKRDA